MTQTPGCQTQQFPIFWTQDTVKIYLSFCVLVSVLLHEWLLVRIVLHLNIPTPKKRILKLILINCFPLQDEECHWSLQREPWFSSFKNWYVLKSTKIIAIVCVCVCVAKSFFYNQFVIELVTFTRNWTASWEDGFHQLCSPPLQ